MTCLLGCCSVLTLDLVLLGLPVLTFPEIPGSNSLLAPDFVPPNACWLSPLTSTTSQFWAGSTSTGTTSSGSPLLSSPALDPIHGTWSTEAHVIVPTAAPQYSYIEWTSLTKSYKWDNSGNYSFHWPIDLGVNNKNRVFKWLILKTNKELQENPNLFIFSERESNDLIVSLN